MGCLNSKLIIERNHNPTFKPKKMIPSREGWVEYVDNSSKLDFFTINRLLRYISGMHNRFNYMHLGLIIRLPHMIAEDKLSIEILESIVYSLIVDYHHTVVIEIKLDRQILTDGFVYSPLRFLMVSNYSLDDFVTNYQNHSELRHYRRIIPKEWTFNGKLGENIFPDVLWTIANTVGNNEFASALAEVSTELVNNANEHNEADCMLDIDIGDEYVKKDGSDGVYYGISLSVISFSSKTLPDQLTEKITQGRFTGKRYGIVADAFEKHKEFFNEDYGKRDFFMTAAFQDKITGRIASDSSGGTGLTRLIQTLEEYSDSSKCYVVSDNRVLFFFQELLGYDKNGWIGFNRENDFQNLPPETGVLKESPIIIPGVAYNLSFVCKKGEANDHNQS